MRWLETENFRSPAALARFVLTTLIGLGLDLWTKDWAFRTMAVYAPNGAVTSRPPDPQIVPGLLHLHVTTNRGAVFGIGQGQIWLFVGVSIAAIVFLTYLFALSRRQRLYQVILGMLLAGVLGNMYDRTMFGYVRDMIHALPQWPNLFPWIFNVADVLLCVGVGLMILYSLVQRNPEPDEAAKEEAADA